MSAFAGDLALESLLSVAARTVTKTIYVRWRLSDILTRATDPGIYQIAKNHDATLCCHRALHAKAYIADDVALVGSANATSPGLNIAARSNLELLVELNANLPCIKELLATLEAEARTATMIPEDLLAKVEASKKSLEYEERNDSIWLPKSSYQDVIKLISSGDGSELALKDCLALGLSIGANEDEVKQAANSSSIFAMLREHLLEKTVGISVGDLSRHLIYKLNNKEYGETRLCLILLNWIENCAVEMYVHNSDSENPVLTPLSKAG